MMRSVVKQAGSQSINMVAVCGGGIVSTLCLWSLKMSEVCDTWLCELCVRAVMSFLGHDGLRSSRTATIH